MTEYDPLGSTVTEMLPLPTLVIALWAGITRTRKADANRVIPDAWYRFRELDLCKSEIYCTLQYRR
jgi:hypothetical protein